MSHRVVQTFPYPEGEKYMVIANFPDNEGMPQWMLEELRKQFPGQRFERHEREWVVVDA